MPAPTDTAALIAELKQVIITECDKDVAPEEIDENDRLIGGALELDSLDALQLSLAVKERYGVRIEGGPDGRVAFETLTTLAKFIQARANA
ncbi:MAG TPA: phosphopantetheine-binding protein [Terricaulis sp.]|nr:phosphopantetheine-binding protein [Terricaulis sp.]